MNTLLYSKAEELQEQIESEFPLLLPTLVPMKNGGWAVQIEKCKFRRSPHYGVTYADFRAYAEKRGWLVDIEDDGRLIYRDCVYTIVESAEYWELALVIAGIHQVPTGKPGRRAAA